VLAFDRAGQHRLDAAALDFHRRRQAAVLDGLGLGCDHQKLQALVAGQAIVDVEQQLRALEVRNELIAN